METKYYREKSEICVASYFFKLENIQAKMTDVEAIQNLKV